MAEKTVLIIDDNEDNRTICSAILRHYGYRVLEARDGAAGLELARTAQPHAIIMDLEMPHLDGWTATNLLKDDRATSHIPVIAVTIHDRASAPRPPARWDAYLVKPYTVQDLLRIVAGQTGGLAADGR